MIERLATIFKKGPRPFDQFQIEVSTYSSFDCRICPRDSFGDLWLYRTMSLEVFERIVPHLHLTKEVSFSGWGNPLENDQLAFMLRSAKEKGCRTSLMTDGARLTDEMTRRLLSAGLDMLVVSVELITGEIRETLAAGGDLRSILAQVEGFIRIKKELGRQGTAVALSFPMTRLNMRDLPVLVPLAAKMGADEVIFHNLAYLPVERCNILRAFYHESPTAAFEQSIGEVKRLGKEMGIPVRVSALRTEEQLVCELDPQRKVFFSADGSVAPCPYLCIPKQGPIHRIFRNREVVVPQVSFGNVGQEDFPSIWEKDSYRRFRATFAQRQKAETNAAQLLDVFSNVTAASLESLSLRQPPPLPEGCQSCYKAYGV